MVIQIAKLFIKLKITPNTITVLGLAMSIIAAILFFFLDFWFFPIFGVFILFIGIIDGVDGAVARRTNKATLSGGLLDSVVDRFSDSILYLGFLKYHYMGITLLYIPIYIWILLAIVGAFLVAYCRSIAEKYLKDYNCDIGLGARSERLFVLAVSSWCFIPRIGLILLTFISFGTVIFRQIKYSKQLKKIDYPNS